MRNYEYRCYFSGTDYETVYANGIEDALILALAKRIEAGKHKKFIFVQCLDKDDAYFYPEHRYTIDGN